MKRKGQGSPPDDPEQPPEEQVYDQEPVEPSMVRERPRMAYRATPQIGARSLLAAAFIKRYSSLLERLGQAAPDDAIADALAAPDEVGGLAALLAQVGPDTARATDPLASARARGAQAKGELLRQAGGALRLGEAAHRLGVSPQAVHARRKRGTLLAVPQANGEWLYPACQFGPDGALPGLGLVLEAFGVRGPWTQLSVLLAPAQALGGRTPLQALQAGEAAAAAQAVSTYGEYIA
ncbi:DNA-binding protein [Longimicrobium sp.]|uniref:DNA-binding protein n=1 Tax=Longimicrobium sp. TaxID=2029185 RepID=UPI003B3B9190